MKRKLNLWLLVVPFLLVSCWNFDDFDNIEIDPFTQSWVFPVLNSEVSFKEMMERSGSNTSIGVDEDLTGNPYLLLMAIRDTLDLGYANEEFSLADIGFSYNVPLSKMGSTKAFPFEVSFAESYDIVNGQEVKRVIFHDGRMEIDITNNFNHSIDLVITIESLKEQGNSYVVTRNNFTPGSNTYLSNDLNTNWELDLYDQESDAYNAFQVAVTISSSEPIENFAGSLSFSIQFNSLEFSEVWGKFNQDFNVPDQVFLFGAFNSTVLADQYFADPFFTLHFDNSYGIPLSLNFPLFEVSNNQGEIKQIENPPGYVLIDGDLNLSDYNIIEPIASPGDEQIRTSLTLNAENSNIDDIFRIAPNRLAFGVDFKIGDESDDHNQFITRNSRVSFITDIVIPLDGWAITHLLTDTIMDVPWPDFDKDLEFFEDDLRVTLKFKMTNELPLNIRFGAITLDEGTFLPVDTLHFDSNIYDDGTYDLVRAAVVDNEGFLVSPQDSYLSLTLTPDEFDRLKGAPHLLLSYKLFTHEASGAGDPDPVKILSTNKLRTRLSVNLRATVNPDNF